MKKLMIVAAALAIAISARAVERLTEASSEAQCRAALAEILAQTNNAAMKDVLCALDFWVVGRHHAAVRDDADAAFAARGFGLCMWPLVTTWPKASAVGRGKNGAETNLTYCIALAKRLKCNISVEGYFGAGASVGELIVVLGELASQGGGVCYADIDSLARYKTYIQHAASKAIKRALRKQGKSFVTKDGVNPCEVYMTRLTAALNAPRFAGLNEWLSELGFEERMDLSGLPSEAEIAKLKEDILYGEVDMRYSNKSLLYVCLGVDGYNAFVKEYNGDKE